MDVMLGADLVRIREFTMRSLHCQQPTSVGEQCPCMRRLVEIELGVEIERTPDQLDCSRVSARGGVDDRAVIPDSRVLYAGRDRSVRRGKRSRHITGVDLRPRECG
jgi:hypothetical protein